MTPTMSTHTLPRFLALAALVLSSTAPVAVHAQAWPTRAVRVIATSPPGGSVDLLARLVADDFSRSFGQAFVVDNRPGANGNIGVDAVVKAPPDGNMLFVTIPGVFSINQHLHGAMPFNPRTDLAPIAMLGYSPLVLVTHPSVPARNVQELVAWLKARPGAISYSSAGVGTTGHLGMELFKSMTGVDVLHVPYKGAAAASADLVSGNVAVTLNNTTAVVPFVQRGQLRALAVAEKTRLTALPDVPTIHESGVPGYEVTPWFGLGTRAGVPRDIINRLNAEAARSLRKPETVARLSSLGIETRFMSPEAFTDYVRAESDRWGDIIRRSGAKAE